MLGFHLSKEENMKKGMLFLFVVVALCLAVVNTGCGEDTVPEDVGGRLCLNVCWVLKYCEVMDVLSVPDCTSSCYDWIQNYSDDTAFSWQVSVCSQLTYCIPFGECMSPGMRH